MLRFDKATNLSFLFKFILSASPWGSDVLLFLKFINIVFIFALYFIEFVISLYTFLLIYFAQYKEHIIFFILFINFSDVLRAISNLWSICFGVNIFNPFPCVSFIGNIPLLKGLRINSWLS